MGPKLSKAPCRASAIRLDRLHGTRVSLYIPLPMTCCHYTLVEGNESAFAVDPSAIAFGAGVLAEAGEHLRAPRAGASRSSPTRRSRASSRWPRCSASLRAAGLDVAVYDEVHVEPTDVSFRAAAEFAKAGAFDGYVSVGGGSVIDTCKAAQLYATYPAELRTYVNAPIGDGKPVPGPLPPHVACPTTCGTGSECTGIAVFDDLSLKAKTGIASRRLRPTLALIDPTCTRTLPVDGRRGERVRRPVPRARVVHGAAVHRARPAPTSRRRAR